MKLTPVEIISIILGVVEVVARVIPTVNNWAPLNWIIKGLNFLSDMLNVTKK